MEAKARVGEHGSIASFLGDCYRAVSVAPTHSRDAGCRVFRGALVAAGSAMRNHLVSVWDKNVTTGGVPYCLALVHDSFASDYLLLDHVSHAATGNEARGEHLGFVARSECLRRKCHLHGKLYRGRSGGLL